MDWFSCSCSPVSYSDYIDVPAPADSLWDVVLDLKALPSILPTVLSLHIPDLPDVNNTADYKKSLAVGTKFEEVREYRNKKMLLTKMITRLEASNPQERYLSLGIAFQDQKGNSYENMSNTSTLTVLPVDDKNSRLLLTVAIHGSGPSKVMHVLTSLFCSTCMRRYVQRYMREEVQAYCDETLRRTAAVEEAEKDGTASK